MAIIGFDTEEDMDEHFEWIEQVNLEYADLKDRVVELRCELEHAEATLTEFLEEHKDIIIK